MSSASSSASAELAAQTPAAASTALASSTAAAAATSVATLEELNACVSRLADGTAKPPGPFAKTARRLATVSIELGSPMLAVAPLRAALDRISPGPNCLTPVHVDFVLVCLKAKAYGFAMRVLEKPILEIRPEATGLATLDFLRYYYYGGMVYMGLKRFRKALAFFQLCITAPSDVLSAVMTEAYKKMLLVSLISKGVKPTLPKYTAHQVSRHIESCAVPYKSVADAFEKYETELFDKVVAEHADAIEKDKNMGLVMQCREALIMRRIQRLTHTFLTLSLDDIAKSSGLPDAQTAESYVLRMVALGDIWATINQRDGMVQFLEDPELYDSDSVLGRLDCSIRNIMKLAQHMSDLDMEISTSPDYVKKEIGNSSRGGRGGGGAGDSRWGEADMDADDADF